MSQYLIEVINRFPVEHLFFIMTFGIFMVVSFPIDVMGFDYSQGLPTIGFLLNEAIYHFSPFIGVKYLGAEFPIGLIKVLLLSLPVGGVGFFAYNIYQEANCCLGRVLHIHRDEPTEKSETRGERADQKANCCLQSMLHAIAGCPDGKEPTEKSEAQETRALSEALHRDRFHLWLKERRLMKVVDLISSMRLAALALLYGSQTLAILVLLSAIFVCRLAIFACRLEMCFFVSALAVFFWLAYRWCKLRVHRILEEDLADEFR